MRFLLLSGLLLAGLVTNCRNRPNQLAGKTASDAVSVQRAPDAALRETRWVPRQLAGRPVAVAADTKEPYLVLRTDGTAEGNGSCNRFRGRFFSETPGELKFSQIMSTRMACPAMGTESDFIDALGQSGTYRISGDTLRLFSAAGAAVARLEAVYLR